MYEFEDNGETQKWFEELWCASEVATGAVLDEYERSWSEPKAGAAGELSESAPAIGHPFELLQQGFPDWPAYLRGIRTADAYWRKSTDDTYGVLPGTSSWVETLRAASTIMLQKWEKLDYMSYQILLGLKVKGRYDYGLLGSMRGAGYAKNVFKDATPENLRIRKIIQTALVPVIDQPMSKAFPVLARQAFETITSIPHFSNAVATRFLALARPEALISVNSASVKLLSKIVGIPALQVTSARGYEQLIRWVMNQPWWQSRVPEHAFEKELWQMRAALLDCFVYQGEHFQQAIS